MQCLVLGIGNTLLSDEGVGVHVIQYLQHHHAGTPGVNYLDGGNLSFDLAPQVQAADHLIVVDAAELKASPGTVEVFADDAMDRFLGQVRRSVHEVGLLDLLDISRLLESLPTHRALVGVQPASIDWGDYPTEQVAAAIPTAARHVLELARGWQDALGDAAA